MGKTVLPIPFILYVSVMYQVKSPGGVVNISITTEFLWFIVPALTAKCISGALMLLQMAVEPSTWENLDEHVKKAKVAAGIFETIAVHNMGMAFISDMGKDICSWPIFTWLFIAFEVSLIAFILISHFYYGNGSK